RAIRHNERADWSLRIPGTACATTAASACRHRRNPRSGGAAPPVCRPVFSSSELYRDNMSFQVTVKPSGHQFTCDEGETVLAAAIRNGIGLPYGCKNGACGTCKGKLLAGEVTHGAHQEKALSAAEEEQ